MILDNKITKFLLMFFLLLLVIFFFLWRTTQSEAYRFAIGYLYQHDDAKKFIGEIKTTLLIGSSDKSIVRQTARGNTTISCAQFQFYARGEEGSKFVKVVMKADFSSGGQWRILGVRLWDDNDLTCSL